jgi:hypothetical protein
MHHSHHFPLLRNAAASYLSINENETRDGNKWCHRFYFQVCEDFAIFAAFDYDEYHHDCVVVDDDGGRLRFEQDSQHHSLWTQID